MIRTDSGTAILPALPEGGMPPPRHQADAVTLLSCYVCLLMFIPSSLVVGPFGAAGAPAVLFGGFLLAWYLISRPHPLLLVDRGPQPVRVAVAVFACAIFAAYVAANHQMLPVLEQNGADRGLIAVCGWLGVSLLAADGIERRDRLDALLGRVVLAASVMAVIGIGEFFTGVNVAKYITLPGLTVHTQVTDLMNRGGLVRVTATTAQPLEFAAVLGMCLPLAFHRARFAPAGLRSWRWSQVGVIVAAIPMTVSRSAVFALAAIFAVLLPTWTKRERRWTYLLAVAAPVLVWLVRPRILASFSSLYGQLGTDTSSTSRSGAIAAALPLIGHHPWFGQGFQTFFPQTNFFVDDQYLTSLIETGAAGALALVALFATGWFTARRMRRASADLAARDLGQCLAASMAAAAVSFATFDALSFTIAAGLFFLLLGCTGAALRLTGRMTSPHDRPYLP
ncbi:MAG TPA: O-antigen ligase family protein [Streptosporangiaceae bacterium]